MPAATAVPTGASPSSSSFYRGGSFGGSIPAAIADAGDASPEPNGCPYSKVQLLRLLRARDGLLEAKAKEVSLLSHQNGTLRDRVSAVEAELVGLQSELRDREEALAASRRLAEQNARAVKRVQGEMEQLKGREAAMHLSVAQSTRLLKLLEQEELKRAALLRERDAATDAVAETRARLATLDMRRAEVEADLQARLARALGELAAAKEHYAGVETRMVAAAAAAADAQKESEAREAIREEELSRARSERYALTQRLQEAQDDAQRARDAGEGTGSCLMALSDQCAAQETALVTIRAEAADAHAAARDACEKAEQDAALAAARAESDREARERLTERLREESRRAEAASESCSELEAAVAARHDDVQRLEARLDAEAALTRRLRISVDQLRGAASVEKTQRRLSRALDKFNAATAAQGSGAGSGGGAIEGGDSAAVADMAGGVTSSAWTALQQQTWSKRQMLSALLQHTASTTAAAAAVTVAAAAESSAAARKLRCAAALEGASDTALEEEGSDSPAAPSAELVVPLSNCGIVDSDVACLADALARAAESYELPPVTVDLSANFITDAGATQLAPVLSLPRCAIRRLDLRYNQVTMEGVRALARTLEGEGATRRGIAHVYVHAEGRIDALGFRSDASSSSSRTGAAAPPPPAAAVPLAPEDLVSIAVVDARNNAGSAAGQAVLAKIAQAHEALRKQGLVAPRARPAAPAPVSRAKQKRAFQGAVAAGAYGNGMASMTIPEGQLPALH